MNLSEELAWRGLVNQTTYKDLKVLDGQPISFYFGVDPSADSMTIGNLAAAMMVKTFVRHGHKAVLLVGGATGMIGDPDGKVQERELLNLNQIAANKQAIAAQYKQIFDEHSFELVDNYDWFKDFKYLDFLRDVGKHVPMRQMLARDFVQKRLREAAAGISYAEFSYVLIQAYDFLHLYKSKGVTLQLCGSDQWGNAIAGVDLVRRETGGEAHVCSMPLILNKATGKKFGKTEDGAVWLDPSKTSPTQFYQFWVNVDDAAVEDYLKIYTELEPAEIEQILNQHKENPTARRAQTALAQAVTKLVHGEAQMRLAESITRYLTGKKSIGEISDNELPELRKEIPSIRARAGDNIALKLVEAGLAGSNREAREIRAAGGVYINNEGVTSETFAESHFQNGRLLLRRGKAFKDSALVELEN